MNNPDFFRGKKALVTGGAKRLGREIALALGGSGTHVAVHYNSSRGPAEAVCEELTKMGVRGIPLQANLDDSTAGDGLFQAAWSAMDGLDILVNNASIFPAGRLEEMALDQVHKNLRVNAWNPFLLIRAFWQKAREAGTSGSVVNLLDTRLVGGDLAHAAYHLSKVTLAEITSMTALEFGPELRVNGVAPGAVLPPEEQDEAYLERLTDTLPLRLRGYPRDIADAALYLLGAGFVTGQVIYVDGGRHLRLGGST